MMLDARDNEIPPPPFDKGGGTVAASSRRSSGRLSRVRPTAALSPWPKASLLPLLAKASLPPPLPKGGFSSGFTLIEVIVTILMAAIMSAFFIQFMGTAMSRSTRAVEFVREEATVEALMEKIITDYVAKINLNETSALSDMNTAINTNKIYDNAQNLEKVTAKYIDFDNSGNEINDSSKLRTLKVTVTAGEHRLTTLLAKSRVNDSPPVPF